MANKIGIKNLKSCVMLVIMQWELYWDRERTRCSGLYTIPTKLSMKLKKVTLLLKKEMLAIVFACENFRPYILGSHIIIHTDHAAIKYLMAKKEAKPRLIRWVLLLQNFDIEVKDKKGCDNVMADHMSRVEKPTVQEEEKEIAEHFPKDQLFQLSLPSPWYADIVNFLACGIMPPKLNYQQRKKN